jgi:copper chaperone CopZ
LGPAIDPRADALTKKKIIRKKRKAPPKPVKLKLITQSYQLEQKIDDVEAGRIIDALKVLGVVEPYYNPRKNSVRVSYSTKKLSSVVILKKLKQLGYTVKEID